VQVTVARKLVAEGVGTALLVAAVVGSGIMAQALAKDPAAALLCPECIETVRSVGFRIAAPAL